MSENISKLQDKLQNEASEFLDTSPLLTLLGRLGSVTRTGSSVTGLMVYPDIDFAVQHKTPNIQAALALVPVLFSEMAVASVKIADLTKDVKESAAYYVGLDILYKGKIWHIDVTVSEPGEIKTDPPELSDWISHMSKEGRMHVLALKKQLIDERRYVGSRSQPPYTFRSSHIYEAVLKGGAKTVREIERYFK